ncbi:MAG: hypothetical protein AAGH15_17435 [Myxococcota bacterium]
MIRFSIASLPFRVGLLAACALAAACGTRTVLKVSPGDGGVPLDMIDVDMGPPPELTLDCGRMARAVPVGEAMVLLALSDGPDDLITGSWSVESTPPFPEFTLDPAGGNPTTFRSETLGDFVFRFDGTNELGERASCEVSVEVFVDLPRALCPEPNTSLGVATGVGQPLVLDAQAVDDRGIAGLGWTLLSGPGPATIEPPTAEKPTFVATVPGSYRLRFDVLDIDGGTAQCEVTVEVVAPPELACSEALSAPVGETVTLEATPTSRLSIASGAFELTGRPADSMATLAPGSRDRRGVYSSPLTLDDVGTFTARFTARDELGQESSCTTNVEATPIPPVVRCRNVETRPLEFVDVSATATDDGAIVATRWTLIELPPGSGAMPPAPADSLDTTFFPDLAGTYVLRFEATDDDGLTSACEARVTAIATEGLRVEVFWDTNRTDMDTHLLNPEATSWFNENDCYYANCDGGAVLDWGDVGVTEDDPSLDIDDTDGFGPENINVDEPAPGTYRVGVHAFRGSANVTVNIYCGGRAEPDETLGPVALRSNEFWRVADVRLGGGRCRITELDDVSTRDDAESRR